jgi:DNA mismatch repair protein MutL
MSQIRILDSALADQIAAGEVIERPASVVKELVENALDAGARTITVEVREGGSELIRVTDDGSGMDREDAALAILRHATSKIRCQADLERIGTLGFRGEALPSIASVSRFKLVTRTREAIEGTEVASEAGGPASVSPIGCAVGTSIEIRDLFFNVPARRKFLKSKATESAQIGEVCLRAALLDSGLRLLLLRDGRRAAEYLPALDWAERGVHIVPDKRVRIEGEHGGVRVRAVLGAPEDSRSGALGLHVFVNGRPVRERNLARSVSYAYGSVMPPGRYPVGLVHIDIAPEEVDVNVHPQKAEVRFQRGREVHEAVTRVLAKALGTSAWKGPVARSPAFWSERLPEGPRLDAVTEPVQRDDSRQAPDPWGLSPVQPVHSEPSTPASVPPRQPALPYAATASAPALARDFPLSEPARQAQTTPKYRALAQSRNLFIIAETERGLCVIDQHAADERVHYDKLRRQYQEREVRTQRLLLPERVELSEREVALVETHAAELQRAGLETTLIGARSAAIYTVPAILRRAAPERLLRDLLDELARSGERGFGDAIDMALATMACHGSIRAGDPLSLPECQALLEQMAGIDEFGGHCPHGRPIVFEMPFDELARKVGR